MQHNEDYRLESLLCQRQSFAARCSVTKPHYDTAQMPERPVFLPDLGAYLVSLREARGWEQSKAADIAGRRKIALSYQALRGLEEGKTKNPEPATLRALAALYEVPYTEIIGRYIERRFGVQVATPVDTESAGVTAAKGTFEVQEAPTFRYVAVMKDRIAAGQPLMMEDGNVEGAIAFAERSLRKWKRPICVRVGKHEESMLGAGIMPNDVVLLECADEARLRPQPDSIYAVRIDNGATLKKVEVLRDGGRTWLVLISENPNKAKYATRIVAVNEDETLLDYIVGRVVWHGQYL